MATAVKRTPKEAKDALTQRRAEAESRAKAETAALRDAGNLRRHQMAAEALEIMLVRATGLRFDTLVEVMAPQPWALDTEGYVLGHLLTIEEAVYLAAVADDRVDGMTLHEAFGRRWADLDERAEWTAVYVDALRTLAEQADGQLEAHRRHEALHQIARDTRS